MNNSMAILPIQTSTWNALISRIANSGMSADEMIKKMLDDLELRDAPKTTLPSVAIEPMSKTNYEIWIFAQKFSTSSLPQILAILYCTLSDRYPNFLDHFSREGTHARKYIAQDPAEIYLKSPHLKYTPHI